MESKQRRALSIALSVLIHGTLAFVLLRVGLHYALPEGTVSDATDFEVVSGPTGVQTEVMPVKPSKEKTGSESAHAPTEPGPGARAKEVVMAPEIKKIETTDDVKMVPYHPPQDVVSADESEAEALPTTPPTTAPEEIAADNARVLPEKKTVSEADEAKPVAEPVAAPEQPQAAPTSGPAGAYGTSGPFLDIRKLKERPGNRSPSYPLIAKFRRQEGKVVLRAFIKPDGRVDLPIVEKSSGFPALDESAIRAFAGWRFEPGPSGWVLKPFQFQLVK